MQTFVNASCSPGTAQGLLHDFFTLEVKYILLKMRFARVFGFYSRHSSLKNLGIAVFAALLVISVGVVGYMNLIGLDPLDALYFTVVTLGSVGYGDIYPETVEAKLFTIFFVLVGVSVFLYAFGAIISMLFEGTIIEVFKMEHVKEKLSKLRGHTILCGYGDVGETIAKQIDKIVIIDHDEAKILKLVSEGIFAFSGDSTRPETLLKAKIDKARAIIIALDSDPDVLFTILTAKDVNPEIKVYARANHRESVSKMRRVGADYVVCVTELAGKELMNAIEKHAAED